MLFLNSAGALSEVKSSVDFTAVFGGEDPAQRGIPVINSGSGSLGDVDVDVAAHAGGAYHKGRCDNHCGVAVVAEDGGFFDINLKLGALYRLCLMMVRK